MQAIISFITGTLNTVAWLYIFLPCTIIFGLYLTIRNRGLQFTKFGYVMKNTLGKMFQKQEAGEGAVTPMQAVSTALAATVGTGNIVGTSQAIALGGYGAIFWLWLAALLGMMVKYSEVLLAIKYRERGGGDDLRRCGRDDLRAVRGLGLGGLFRLAAGGGGQGRLGRFVRRLIGDLDARGLRADAKEPGLRIVQHFDGDAVAVHAQLLQRSCDGQIDRLTGCGDKFFHSYSFVCSASDSAARFLP